MSIDDGLFHNGKCIVNTFQISGVNQMTVYRCPKNIMDNKNILKKFFTLHCFHVE